MTNFEARLPTDPDNTDGGAIDNDAGGQELEGSPNIHGYINLIEEALFPNRLKQVASPDDLTQRDTNREILESIRNNPALQQEFIDEVNEAMAKVRHPEDRIVAEIRFNLNVPGATDVLSYEEVGRRLSPPVGGGRARQRISRLERSLRFRVRVAPIYGIRFDFRHAL